jgi:hypothetical protein
VSRNRELMGDPGRSAGVDSSAPTDRPIAEGHLICGAAAARKNSGLFLAFHLLILDTIREHEYEPQRRKR